VLNATAAVLAALPMAAEGEDSGGFHAPTIEEFFPAQLVGEGTWWGPTRINLIMLLATLAMGFFFWMAFRKPKLVPSGVQNVGEMAVDVVYGQVIDEVMGKRGRRFAPLLVTMFFLILAMNVTGLVPLLHMPATAVIGVPLVLALTSYATFNYAGIKANGFGRYMHANLVPPGVPGPMLLLVVPIEFVSTFLLRPFTLAVRLMANMMSGHILLVLFYSATSYFLLEAEGLMKVFGVASYAAGFAFSLFECLVIVLQAYIFTLLTAVYIDGALSAEH
jgi:F-type H+-transporting ATPase subunit a